MTSCQPCMRFVNSPMLRSYNSSSSFIPPNLSMPGVTVHHQVSVSYFFGRQSEKRGTGAIESRDEGAHCQPCEADDGLKRGGRIRQHREKTVGCASERPRAAASGIDTLNFNFQSGGILLYSSLTNLYWLLDTRAVKRRELVMQPSPNHRASCLCGF